MAMTIRFDDDETQRLRAMAEAEGISMQAAVRRSVNERVTRLSVRTRLMDAWGPIPQAELDRAARSLDLEQNRAAS
jgi:predicted transcriptional regulator